MKKIAANPEAWGVAAEYVRSPGIKEATERVISHMQVLSAHLKTFLQLSISTETRR